MRREANKKFRKKLDKENEDCLEEILLTLYKAFDLKKQYEEENTYESKKDELWADTELQLLNLFYSRFENIIKATKKFIKQEYNISLNLANIKFKDLLYNKDGKTFEERIQNYIEAYKTNRWNRQHCPYHMERLLHTETTCITYQLYKMTLDKMIEEGRFPAEEFSGGCDLCNSMGYNSGELYRPDEIDNEPPFHPCCQCEFFPHECDEIEARELYPEAFIEKKEMEESK